jgi:hypothetical protein
MQNITALKAADGKIQQRVTVRHTPGMNADMSIDARQAITPKKQHVKDVKTSKSTANGQYSKEASTFTRYRVVFYKYLPNQVFRRDCKTGLEVPILEKIEGEWFPCEGVTLTQNEINQMRPFTGAAGLDVDGTIARKRPLPSASKGTANYGSSYTYRCRQDNDPMANRRQHRKDKKQASKMRSLIASVQIENVKRK